LRPAKVSVVSTAPAPLRLQPEQLAAVLQHAVVVEADGDEYQVAPGVGTKGFHHVVEQAELRRAQRAVDGEAALGEQRLRHAGLGGHGDVAREHDAVERIARVAPHEVGAHRADQGLQPPDARPFADGVGERHLLGGEEGDQHVIHIAAVVHDEDHGRLRVDRRQAGLVTASGDHAVEQARDAFRQPVADAEVEVGVEGGHDLARVAVDAAAHVDERLAALPRLRRGGGLDARVVEEAVDQHLAPGQLERRQLDPQAGVELADDGVDAAAEEPAHARRQQQHAGGPGGEQRQDDEQPKRDTDAGVHASSRRHIRTMSNCS